MVQTSRVAETGRNLRDSRILKWAMVAVVVVGIGLRLAQWGAAESLWHDEAMLALNVARHDARTILGPLDYFQAGPPAYLVTLRMLYERFGPSERALRAPSLVAGAAALVRFALVAREALGAAGALVVAAFFALADREISHSAELKSYAIDVLVAVVLLWLAVRPDWTLRKRIAWMSAVAAVGVWWSFPTIFVYAGLVLALGLAAWRRERLSLMVGALTVGASQVAVYLLNIRAQRVADLVESWAEDYVPWSHPLSIPRWLGVKVLDLFVYPSHEIAGGALLALAGIGLFWCWRSGYRRVLMVLMMPAALTLLAAALRKYPFGGSRATLFLSPMVILAAGMGVDGWRHIFPRLAGWWWVLPAVLLGAAAPQAIYHLAEPRCRSDVRSVAQYLQSHIGPGDEIYIANGTCEFLWYWRGQTRTLHGKELDGTDLPWKRFWVVGAFTPGKHTKVMDQDLENARKVADEREKFVGKGGAAFLFVRREGAGGAGGAGSTTKE
jgi:hypothetical protein